MKKLLAILILLAFVVGVVAPVNAFADRRDLTYKSITEFNDEEVDDFDADDDDLLVYDSSTETIYRMFLGSLLSNRAGASTAASSSTGIAPADMPYIVYRKYVGGDSGVDETGVGTILPNGKDGQVLILICQEVDSNGSWIVTPTTSLTISSLTFDAQGETTTLIYVDDTTGWLVLSNYGTTVTLKKQTGIPAKP